MDEMNKQNMGEVSGGWGKETENYGMNFIFTPDEFKTLQEAYPDLKIRKANTQSIAVPEGSSTYIISSGGNDWMAPEKIVDMVQAKFGDVEYITHNGKLFIKKNES